MLRSKQNHRSSAIRAKSSSTRSIRTKPKPLRASPSHHKPSLNSLNPQPSSNTSPISSQNCAQLSHTPTQIITQPLCSQSSPFSTKNHSKPPAKTQPPQPPPQSLPNAQPPSPTLPPPENFAKAFLRSAFYKDIPLASKPYAPLQVIPQQKPQFKFPTDIPGVVVYALDEAQYKRATNGDLVPISMTVSSLLALSFWNWSEIASALFVGCAIMSGWNLHSRSQFVTRVSVEPGKERCHRPYPRLPGEQTTINAIKAIHIEQKNFPFSMPKVITIQHPESIERGHDPSYLKKYIDLDDMNVAMESPGHLFIQLTAEGKHHVPIQLDQVRNITYLNQVLARVGKDQSQDWKY